MQRHTAFVIIVDGETAGIAVRDRRGFVFHASDSRFDALDGRQFRRLRAASSAARTLVPPAGRHVGVAEEARP